MSVGRIRQCVTSFGSHRRNTDRSLWVSISSYRHRSDLVRYRSGSGETTVVEGEQNPAVGLWGRPRGGHWPPRPTSRILSTDCWCWLVPTHATKAFWMAGVVVMGWRYRGVVANSHQHWLSPPVCLWQLSFIELVVQCWQGLVETEAELDGECQKWDASWSSTVRRPVQCGLNGTTPGHK